MRQYRTPRRQIAVAPSQHAIGPVQSGAINSADFTPPLLVLHSQVTLERGQPGSSIASISTGNVVPRAQEHSVGQY
eukprot:1500301-Rhodomonas_salina.1